MLDPSILYDPITQKCCVRRCTKVISMIDTAVTSLQTDIVRQLSEYAKLLEDKIHETTVSSCQPIYDAIEALEAQVKDLYEQIQTPLLSEYGRIRHGIESIIGDTPYPYDDTEPSPIESVIDDTTPTPLADARFAYDEAGQVIQLPTPSATVTQAESSTPTPSSTQAQSSTPTPTKAETSMPTSVMGQMPKTPRECVEIDLCGELRLALQPLGQLVDLLTKAILTAYPTLAVQVLRDELGRPGEEEIDENLNRAINDRMGYHVEPNPELGEVKE